MARPKNKESDILSAAIEVFLEKGFSETTIKDIADRAGIGKGTVYEYFKSKNELFVQSLKQDLSKITANAKSKVPSNGPFLTKLTEFINILEDAFTENYGRLKYYLGRTVEALSPEAQLDYKNLVNEVRHDMTSLIVDILKDGIAEQKIAKTDTYFAAAMITGMVSVYSQRCLSNNFSEEQKKEEKEKLINMIMNGIGKR